MPQPCAMIVFMRLDFLSVPFVRWTRTVGEAYGLSGFKGRQGDSYPFNPTRGLYPFCHKGKSLFTAHLKSAELINVGSRLWNVQRDNSDMQMAKQSLGSLALVTWKMTQ